MTYCGIDEVGRGPLAGPVWAVAVFLPTRCPKELFDSKQIPPATRASLVHTLRRIGALWSSGYASPHEIDAINIRNATCIAMARAYQRLATLLHEKGVKKPMTALVDGKDDPKIGIRSIPIIKGDAVIPEIQAASILAKHARDLVMIHYSKHFPQYGFEKHKGYPTLAHRRAIQSCGLSAIHRKTFRGCHSSSQNP